MRKFTITVNGVPYKVDVQDDGEIDDIRPAKVAAPKIEKVEEVKAEVKADVKAAVAAAPAPVVEVKAVSAGETAITAPMPGKVIQLKVNVGEQVKNGDVVLILEAMKMQNEIKAEADGEVKSINVTAGQSVKPGETMIIIG